MPPYCARRIRRARAAAVGRVWAGAGGSGVVARCRVRCCVSRLRCGRSPGVGLLTVQETAERLKIAPVTVRRYIASGRLPAVRVGRAVRVWEEAVERLLTPIEPKPVPSRERPARRPSVRKGQPTSEDDPLWNIVGMVDDPEGPTDVASNKHTYPGEADADLHHERRLNLVTEDGPEGLTESLLRLVGIAGSNGEADAMTDISADKYTHLANIYAPRRS